MREEERLREKEHTEYTSSEKSCKEWDKVQWRKQGERFSMVREGKREAGKVEK